MNAAHNEPTARDFDHLFFEIFNAAESAGPDFDLRAELEALDAADGEAADLRAAEDLIDYADPSWTFGIPLR